MCLASSEGQHSFWKILHPRSIFDTFSPFGSTVQNHAWSCGFRLSYPFSSHSLLSSTTFQTDTTPACISFFTSNKWSGKRLALKLWELTHPGGGGCQDELNIPLSPPDALMDYNPQFPQYTERFKENLVMMYGASRLQRKFHPRNEKPPWLQTTPTLHPSTDILPTQFRLAIITEMIHTGSLLHDDVLDASALWRGVSSAPNSWPNSLYSVGISWYYALILLLFSCGTRK